MLYVTRLTLLSVCFAVLLTSFVTAQNSSQKIDDLLGSYSHFGQLNGAILVAENNKVIFRKSFGWANREWQVQNTPNTKFRIGSVTKSFTSVLIFQLAEKGLLKLDGKVSDYLHEFPKFKGDKITINHLLTHKAGLRDN